MLNVFIPNEPLSVLFLCISVFGMVLLFGSIISLSFSFKKTGNTEIPKYFPVVSWAAVAFIIIGSGYAVVSSMHYTIASFQVMDGYTLYMLNLQLGLTWLYVIGLLFIALIAAIRPLIQIATGATTTHKALKAILVLSILCMIVGGIDATINQVYGSIGNFDYF